jgi:hypothetical protein
VNDSTFSKSGKTSVDTHEAYRGLLELIPDSSASSVSPIFNAVENFSSEGSGITSPNMFAQNNLLKERATYLQPEKFEKSGRDVPKVKFKEILIPDEAEIYNTQNDLFDFAESLTKRKVNLFTEFLLPMSKEAAKFDVNLDNTKEFFKIDKEEIEDDGDLWPEIAVRIKNEMGIDWKKVLEVQKKKKNLKKLFASWNNRYDDEYQDKRMTTEEVKLALKYSKEEELYEDTINLDESPEGNDEIKEEFDLDFGKIIQEKQIQEESVINSVEKEESNQKVE